MTAPGHFHEDKIILSLSAIPVISQLDTALIFESIGLGSQDAPVLCIAPRLREKLSLLSLALTFHNHVTLGMARFILKPQSPHL